MNWIYERLYADGRLSEWVASAVLLGFALALSTPGNTFSTSISFGAFATIFGGETALAVPLTMVATARIAALLVNGRVPIVSHRIRAVGALVGAVVFASMAYTFALPLIEGETTAISTAVTTYGILALGDMAAVWRAQGDVERARRNQP